MNGQVTEHRSCKFCEREYAFICLVEGEYDWTKSETVYVCHEHLNRVYGVIERWTRAEWLLFETE